MMAASRYRLCVLVGLLLGGYGATATRSWSAQVLVPTGSVWKYLDNGTDQGPAWTAPGFDDSAWASGPAQLGYGDGDEVTLVGFGPDPGARYITTYFRHSFVVTNTANITSLTVRLLRDDGGVVYLNGVEFFRSNMPGGAIEFNTLALVAAGGADETTNFYPAQVPPNLLLSGANTLAVEIHQNAPNSSDLSFDLELAANLSSPTNPPPVPPTILTQPQSQTVPAGTNVTFSVEATGTQPLFYRWRRNSLTIPGATNSVLTLFNVQPTNGGNYSVVVSNIAGTRISTNAFLQVIADTNQPPIPPTVVLTRPTNGAIFLAPATILLNASANDPDGFVTSVAFFAGTNKIAEDLVVPYAQVWSNVPPGNYQLTAVATDNSNLVGVSAPVNITVIGSTNPPVAPTILTHPQSQIVTAGATVSFNVVANGTPPLIYRWHHEESLIAVTTDGVLTLFNVQASQAGLYSVVVSNIAGFAISSNALLQVLPANTPPVANAQVSPLITLFPDGTNVFVISPNNSNATVVLDASLSSDADNDPLQFAWLRDAMVIAVGVRATNELEVGIQIIVLVVDDGTVADTALVAFEIVTAGDAVDLIAARLEESAISSATRRPLVATLRLAEEAFDAGEFETGSSRLESFQHKVQNRITPLDPELATLLINAAQAIIDAVGSP